MKWEIAPINTQVQKQMKFNWAEKIIGRMNIYHWKKFNFS
jgi:hypothetical protein